MDLPIVSRSSPGTGLPRHGAFARGTAYDVALPNTRAGYAPDSGEVQVRIFLAIVVAILLGVGASVLFFSRNGGSVTDAPAADLQADDDELVAALPPPETFEPVFEPCAHCHQVGDGARHTSGPELNGIVGTRAAVRDYPYSAPMRESGLVWDEATLGDFLVDPDGVVPGTRMLLEGLSRPEADRIVGYLKSLDRGPAPPTGTSEN